MVKNTNTNTHLSTTEEEKLLIAIPCNGKVISYLKKGKWIKDTSDYECIFQPSDILNYCKKIFKNNNIQNYFESYDWEYVTIECGDEKNCKEISYWTRPYECTMTMDSEPLLVPDECEFMFLNREPNCMTHNAWMTLASDHCQANYDGKLLRTSPFNSCGVGLYNGVEFVCCYNSTKKIEIEKADRDEIIIDVDGTEHGVGVKLKDDLKDEIKENKHILYEEYLIEPKSFDEESDYYSSAIDDLMKSYHSKLAELMKHWTVESGNLRNAALEDDLKSATQNEISVKYQKLYKNVEDDNHRKKKQIQDVHQWRIQDYINDEKRIIYDKFVQNLHSLEKDTQKIGENLADFISVETKDIEHAIKHLKDKHSEHRNAEINATVSMLMVLDKKDEDKVKSIIAENLTKMENLINTSSLISSTEPKNEKQTKTNVIQNVETKKTDKKVNPVYTSRQENVQNYEILIDENLNLNLKNDVKSENKIIPLEKESEIIFNESKLLQDNNFENVANSKIIIDETPITENYRVSRSVIKKTTNKNTNYVSMPVGILLSAIPIVIVIILIVFLVKRKSLINFKLQNKFSRKYNFEPLNKDEHKMTDDSKLAEQLQYSGYENPTYVYFEKNKQHTNFSKKNINGSINSSSPIIRPNTENQKSASFILE
ncbi:hypothetical protein A3Q56_03492 [Intoshia linei]|uniref:Amyloid-beta A4 protein n=1 Tax=Intoshia linei TaxID=1819745 RepID=A0A177B3A3_9BILA|nr:hypothetical protein A3Q56_03492 [Intoshia linei]